MSIEYEQLTDCLRQVRTQTDFVPELALVLGSGLGDFAQHIQIEKTVEYSQISGFPTSTVHGHAGRFVFGFVEGVPIVAMQGRVHYYEGYSMQKVVLPIRLMGLLGAKRLILTNAAGGIHPDFVPGDLMAITGHISSFVPSPLIGENPDELGPRFPDMSAVYDPQLLQILQNTADRLNIPLKRGVYLQTSGPNYETPQEIKMFAALGADAVGMSTACEAMAARHMGLAVCAVSCITNLAAGISAQPLDHREVEETAARIQADFSRLIRNVILEMGRQK